MWFCETFCKRYLNNRCEENFSCGLNEGYYLALSKLDHLAVSHYWDSLSEDRSVILEHLRSLMGKVDGRFTPGSKYYNLGYNATEVKK